MNKKYQGKLISLEGIDGCGKTTLATALSAHLEHMGHSVILTKEPGGSMLGAHLRAIVQTSKDTISPKAEFLLYAADRAQHFQQVIIPALKTGKIVISDRMNDSSVAYQGYGRGLDINMIEKVNSWVMEDIKQNLIFFLDIDPQTAMSRILKRNEQLTRFEQEKLEFWQRVRSGYQKIFKECPYAITLDGLQPPETLLKQALEILKI